MTAFTRERFGIGLRTRHYPEALDTGLGAPWVEAITENFLGRGGRPARVLERVRDDARLLLHGVSMNIGGTSPLDERYLDELSVLVERFEPDVVSDHLCFSGFGGHWSHDLWPIPYTEQALEHVAQRVERVQNRLDRRIALENPSRYVAFAGDTMAEWEFLNSLSELTGCGVLLDVNNVFVSAHNLGFDASEYLTKLRVEPIMQLHVAGHSQMDGYLLDDHGGPVSDRVWQLFDAFVTRCNAVPIIFEWDGDVPDLPIILAEARRIEEHLARSRMAA